MDIKQRVNKRKCEMLVIHGAQNFGTIINFGIKDGHELYIEDYMHGNMIIIYIACAVIYTFLPKWKALYRSLPIPDTHRIHSKN